MAGCIQLRSCSHRNVFGLRHSGDIVSQMPESYVEKSRDNFSFDSWLQSQSITNIAHIEGLDCFSDVISLRLISLVDIVMHHPAVKGLYIVSEGAASLGTQEILSILFNARLCCDRVLSRPLMVFLEINILERINLKSLTV